MTGKPETALSVVIAATDGPLAVGRTLASLAGQGPVEIIVVTADFETAGIRADAGTDVPRLRRIGLEASSGRVVAFIEDSCVALPGWAEGFIGAFADPKLVAASGMVERDEAGSALDRAVFICEYAPFFPPARPGRTARLAGNNFAVEREAALHECPVEVHETSLLAALDRRGDATRTVEGAIVRHVRSYGAREAVRDRLRFGFEYGRLRAGTGWRRLVGLVAGPAIFASQAGRLAGMAIGDPRLLAGPAATLSITLGLLAAWSLGEWAGWALGPRAPLAGRRRRGTAGRTSGRMPDRVAPRPGGCKAGPPAV